MTEADKKRIEQLEHTANGYAKDLASAHDRIERLEKALDLSKAQRDGWANISDYYDKEELEFEDKQIEELLKQQALTECDEVKV